MSTGLGRVERTLYRSLLRLARSFDKEPALKALICRNHGPPLPEPLDGLVARFLGSPAMNYYWPPPAGQPAPRVAHAVQEAFRKPPEGTGLEGAFQGIRYLSGLLAVAHKHRILQELAAAAADSSSGGDSGSREGQVEQQQQQRQPQRQQQEQEQEQQQEQHGWRQQAGCSSDPAAELAAAVQAAAGDEPSSSGRDAGVPGGAHLAGAPVRGSLLVAHPCLAGNIFARSVVLVCRHDATGSYGLVLNKPLGSSLQHLHERLRQLQGGGGAAGATAGAGAGGAGGRLLGGGQGGAWEAAGGAGTASELEAASGDIPAEQLQQVVDYLAWKGSLQAAAAAAPEYDEYGNWIEQPYTEGDEAELAALGDSSEEEEDSEEEDGGAASLPIYFLDSPGSRARGRSGARGAAGVGVGLAPARAGGAAEAEAVEESSPGSEGEGGEAPPLAAEEDAKGVSAMLRELLRRVGGGSVIMLDADGNVWSHHLATSASDGFQLEGSDTYADDEPESVAALVQQSLTQEDRQLLTQLDKAAQAERVPGQQESAAAGAAVDTAAAEDAAGRAAVGQGGAAKAKELWQRVNQLLSTQQARQGQRQAEPARGQLAGASVSSLFGSASLFGMGSSEGSAAAAAGAAGSSDSKGGTSVGELMSLFKQSPLFRGGPVPGVQVLHQRPRLGGQLALAPWGPRPEDAPGKFEQQAAKEAVVDAAEAELQGPSGCLEGGLFVGADLSLAQELVDEGYLSPTDLRVCMGDSGWSPGQLEAEVARGTWAVVDASPAFLDLFNPAATRAPSQAGSRAVGGSDALAAAATAEAVLGYEGEMWSRCLRSLGPEFAALAQVPKAAWEDLAELEV
ncbi:hypothetical protein ABPG77_003251 [Micractinium sp. CCAP 211/92]